MAVLMRLIVLGRAIAALLLLGGPGAELGPRHGRHLPFLFLLHFLHLIR